MPIIQDNPSYFSDPIRDDEMDDNNVFYSRRAYRDFNSNQPLRIKPRAREPLSSEDTDVFLSSCESAGSAFSAPDGQLKETSFGGKPRTNEGRKGLTHKIGNFFWKSKSKHSLGSESRASGSTIESVCGPESPRFTPDSSLSIYTSSIEGDRESSNSSSNSPNNGEGEGKMRQQGHNQPHSSSSSAFYRFDDCERYAANMYYNMGVQQQPHYSRPRNNSVPIASAVEPKEKMNEIQDYYRNPTFSTFPNPRRHSVASTSGSQTSRKNKKHNQIIEDKDGYLRPNEPRNMRNVKNVYYNNESQQVKVHVDVHSQSPTSASSLTSTEFEASTSSASDGGDGRRNLRDLETSVTTTATDDSTSTVIVGSSFSSLLPCYQNETFASSSSNNSVRTKNNERIGSKTPVCLSRIRRVIGNDCDPYCSLCGLTSTMIASTFKSKMDVAIVSCQECFFSKNAEAQIRGVLDKVVTMDKQKMDVKLQSYDLKDLEHSKVAADVHQCKVQIVIISHHFLQRLKLEASTRLRISPVNKVFRSKRVVAVLVGGINQDEICEGYQTILAKFGEWFCVELRSSSKLDAEFCKKFTEQVVKIYNLEQCNTSNFSVFPKKVTRDQPKIIVMLKKPIEPDDEVRVQFSCGRKIEGSTFSKIENPFTLCVRVPDTLSPERTAYVEVTVFVNGQKLGITCIKSDLQRRQSSDEDAVERMIKMVPGFVKLFDEHVKQTLIKNYRECTDFLTDPAIELMNDVLICRGDEFPTVMHFAAYYGLAQTAFTVLDEADGLEQCKVANDQGFKPLDLAEYRNHDNVAQIIQDLHIHQEISASCQEYQLTKEINAKESVLELSKKEIVSKSRYAQEVPLPSYENLPETAITDTNEMPITPSKDQNQNTSLSAQEDQKSCNSAGSYITWNNNQINANGASEIPTVTVTPNSNNPIKKPKPAARSPKLKVKRGYEYANVNGDENTATEINTVEFITVEEHIEEQVRLRHPREGGKHARDATRRQSISPVQVLDYDVPRLVNEDYKIPPPNARPVYFRTTTK